jgi:hypothetical protein
MSRGVGMTQKEDGVSFYKDVKWDLALEEPYPDSLEVIVRSENGELRSTLRREQVLALRAALDRWINGGPEID